MTVECTAAGCRKKQTMETVRLPGLCTLSEYVYPSLKGVDSALFQAIEGRLI
jgi:hypothetical protein